MQKERAPAVLHLVALGDVGRDLVAGEVPEEQVVGARAAPVAVPEVGRPGEAASPRAAVLADLVEGLDDQRSCPMRSATGGSLPALTSAASCGASFSVLGNFAGSVTTSGPSSLPIRPVLPAWARAPAATTAVRSPTSRAIRNRDLRWPVRGVHQGVNHDRPPMTARPAPIRAPTAAPWPGPATSVSLGDTAPAGAQRQAARQKECREYMI